MIWHGKSKSDEMHHTSISMHHIKKYFILRKEYLIGFSLLVSVLNFIFLINDVVQITKDGTIFTEGNFYVATVHLLSVAMLAGMLSFVYSALMSKRICKILAASAIASNFLLMILRFSFEASFSGYRPM